MKELFLIFSILFLSLNSSAQRLALTIKGNSDFESKIIDSLNYNHDHTNAKSILGEISSISERLTKIGYIENSFAESVKVNDSTFSCQFSLKSKINFNHIQKINPLICSLNFFCILNYESNF